MPLSSRIRRRAVFASAIAMFGLATAAVAPSKGTAAAPVVVADRAMDPGTLRVMSYNVEGLPSPIKTGRSASLERIGEGLAAMRRAGRAPQVVMLQEAFIDPARPVEAMAGYRYAVRGPSADDANLAPPSGPLARAFTHDASALKGEGVGKWESSGLRILSDYPIVRIERMAFPQWACAGYDCLANKGALIAWIKLPGEARPVPFVDTHLNSRGHSGVSSERADEAYAFQAAELRSFVARSIPAGSPAFVGGDFNTDDTARWQVLGTDVLRQGRNALATAIRDHSISPGAQADVAAILKRDKDWLYYRGSRSTPVAVARYSVPFGRQADGSSLSDHLGYAVDFRIGLSAART